MNAPLRSLALVLCAPLLLLAVVLGDAVAALAYLLRGRSGYQRVVVAGARALAACLQALSSTHVHVRGQAPAAPSPAPFIVVANHQPPVDMLLLGLCFADHLLAFVARRGIARAVPLAGLYMAVTGSVRVAEQGGDRQLPGAMQRLAQRAREQRGGVALFPEGLTGWGPGARQRPFQRAGLRRLMRALPDAPLVPVVFDGCDGLLGGWRGLLPRCGQQVEVCILPAIAADSGSIEDRITACEQAIHREQALCLARRATQAPAAPLPPGRTGSALP